MKKGIGFILALLGMVVILWWVEDWKEPDFTQDKQTQTPLPPVSVVTVQPQTYQGHLQVFGRLNAFDV